MPARKKPENGTAKLAGDIRDRVLEFRRVSSEEISDNDRNWRTHPHAQKAALSEVLAKIGIAGALTAYYSERNDGKLTLIDGHERRSRQAEWPTLILDVNDAEADLLLATLDPITGLAETDGPALQTLLDGVEAGTPALEDLIRQLVPADVVEQTGRAAEDTAAGPPEMELQAFEHYDYVLVLSSSLDWSQAVERMGLRQEAFTLRDGERRKIGRGRVVAGARLLELLGDEASDDAPS